MPSVSSRTEHRSKLFVDRRLQGDIVKRILLHWLSFVVVGTLLAATLRWFTHPTIPFSQQMGAMFASFGPFLVALVALLPVFVLDTIKLTNRFAGPYVRFRKHIRALVANETRSPIKFRDGDFWRETEEDLNALLSLIAELEDRRNPASPPQTSAAASGAVQ